MKNINIPKDAISSMTREQLVSWLGTASKRANQRMRQLEKDRLDTSSLAYKHIKEREVDHSSSLAKTKHGETKFKTTFKGRTIQDLRRQAKDVLGFLNTKTSTSRGARARHEKAYNKFVENRRKEWIEDGNTAESFVIPSREAWANAWEIENMKMLESLLTSDQRVRITQYAQDMGLTDAQFNDIIAMVASRKNIDGITAYNDIMGQIKKYGQAIEDGEIEPNGTDSLSDKDLEELNNISSVF